MPDSDQQKSSEAGVDLPTYRRNRRIQLLAFMQLTREFDSRFEKLLLTGRVSKWYSEVGNEATTVTAGMALEAGDALCTLHRDLGAILAHYLDPARTFPGCDFGEPDGLRPEPRDLLYRLACQLLGRGDGFSQGVERSFHYSLLNPEQGIFHVGMISHLGSMIPVAAGCAFARKHAGTDRIAVNFIGDGGTSTGDFHEGLNMAAVWKLPLILIVENNRYAFSTPTDQQYAAQRLSDRGAGYGIAAETVDGNDPDEMSAAMNRAVRRARAGRGPTLIEAMLGRMRGHSEGDDSLKMVPPGDLELYQADDPLPRYRQKLLDSGLIHMGTLKAIESRVADLVEEALSAALDALQPSLKTAHRMVFAPDGIKEQSLPGAGKPIARNDESKAPEGRVTYLEAIHQALTEEMEADERVLLMGQDIGSFEGAFRATRGLYQRWPKRVLDTPIAESGTLGIAIGASLSGYRVVVEMQFADFISCGFNQLVNVAAKLYYRWQIPCPIVVRLPSGGGVGAGPFHSQNPEGWFAHTAGLKVVCPATAEDAKGLLKAAIRDPNPVVFCENKYLYRRVKGSLELDSPPATIGRARIVRQGSDLTLVGYGASTLTCLATAEKLAMDGVEAEVVDLRSLVPFDETTVIESVKRTSRVLIVHEAQRTLGFGAEIAARIADAAFPWLDAPIRRVTYPDSPVPYARNLEQELLPDTEKALAAARAVLRY